MTDEILKKLDEEYGDCDCFVESHINITGMERHTGACVLAQALSTAVKKLNLISNNIGDEEVFKDIASDIKDAREEIANATCNLGF